MSVKNSLQINILCTSGLEIQGGREEGQTVAQNFFVELT